MLIVRVELHSAITGKVTELARMLITNKGDEPNPRIGNYTIRTLKGRSKTDLDKGTVQRSGEVLRHRRLDLHLWVLVAKALRAVGYDEEA